MDIKIEKKLPHFLLFTSVFILSFYSVANAQTDSDGISLKECIEYGLIHNNNVQKAKLDIDKNQEKITEGVSAYLPQVRGSGTLNDNLKLQTSILPGEIFGRPGVNMPVQFGTQYNLTGSIDATQVLYNQALLYGIKGAQASILLASLNETKTKEQLMYDIASVYYAAQITQTQISIANLNLHKVDTLVKIIETQYDYGFAKKIDFDRLKVNQTNAKTELENLNLSYQQQLVLLKYYLGMPLDSVINLPSEINTNIQTIGSTNNSPTNITDYRILESQRALYNINLRQVKAGYIPTLSLSYRYAYQLQQNTSNFFSNNANWFPNSYLAVSLNVPIFDGFNKLAKSQQLNIQLMQLELGEKNLAESLKMQHINAQNKMKINLSAVQIQSQNMQLAQDVYNTSLAQYQGGIASLSDLLNAETSLKEAQTNYLKTLVQVKMAELEILKATGNLEKIIQ